MMLAPQASHWLPTQCVLGESPLWDERNHSLYFVDITAGRIHRVGYGTTQVDTVYQAQAAIGALALTSDVGMLLCTEGSQPRLIDIDTGAIVASAPAASDHARHRYNDGVCDAAGRFITGLMDAQHAPASGRLDVYAWSDGHFSRHTLCADLGLPNGMAWSPNGRQLYWVDSTAQTIYCGDYDVATAGLAQVRPWVHTPADLGRPDGLAVDGLGQVWVSQFMGGCVLCYGPDGVLRQRVSVAAPRVTSLAFIGPAQDVLAVTTAQFGLDAAALQAAPLSGDVFLHPTAVTGLARPYFALD
ncbi:MAG: SMP-30/gluconolactonase/LRE family protein [Neisseriaceae bacterium]|nr:SMP-30/gluconolactonase/LRE family protein [Neisseriaceae bacterium]